MTAAWRTARAWPSGEGWVMWKASDDMPQPTSSPRMVAPRAVAWSQDSSNRTAPPSPRTMPSRSALNGRQVVGDMARMASQARTDPAVEIASEPPTRAQSTWPVAITCADEAQALEVAKTGPRISKVMATALTPSLSMPRGTDEGCMRGDFRPKYRS